MVELLLLGHHERAGLRYGDAQVNLCVMLAANLWRAGGEVELVNAVAVGDCRVVHTNARKPIPRSAG